MTTLLGVLMLAAPLVALVSLAVAIDRRRLRREAAIARQIALTDALHARIGGAVTPFVRRRAGRWQIAMALPFERPAIVSVALDTVDGMFGQDGYEMVLSRQASRAPQRHAGRAARLGKESLSWT